jgi:DnaJ-class molecular chaperone
MNWRRLLGHLNPAAYERARCDSCDGTGFELVNGKPRFGHGGPVHCEKCHGRGWHMVKRDSG